MREQEAGETEKKYSYEIYVRESLSKIYTKKKKDRVLNKESEAEQIKKI